MIKMLSRIFIIITLVMGTEISCSRSSVQEEKSNETGAAAPVDASRQSDQAGKRSRKHMAQSQKPHGRGFGRFFKDFTSLELTPGELGAVEIITVKAALRSMHSRLKAMGKVLSPQQKRAIVSYAFPARIADVHVAVGDWVKAGEKLVTLQSEEVGKARADFFVAQADFELAGRNLERETNLYDHGVGARKNLLASETEFKVAEANLDAAEKKLHVLGFSEAQVEELKNSHQINPIISLDAPIGGKIIAINAVRGSMIDQNTEILGILDPTLVWVDAEIYKRDIARIKLGQDVKISVPAYADECFSGKVIYIGDVLKEETRTITVRTEVPNREYKLKPGMFADMTISLNHNDDVLAVPEEAVLEDQGEKIVFVRVGGEFQLQTVQTGMKESGFREIIAGLEEGQDVVIVGNYQLKSKLYDEILKSAGVH